MKNLALLFTVALPIGDMIINRVDPEWLRRWNRIYWIAYLVTDLGWTIAALLSGAFFVAAFLAVAALAGVLLWRLGVYKADRMEHQAQALELARMIVSGSEYPAGTGRRVARRDEDVFP